MDNSAPPNENEINLTIDTAEQFNSFCERIIGVFGGDLDKNSIIEFIEYCRHTSITPNATFPPYEKWPLLAAMIHEAHWIPSLGYASPLPNDTRTFDTNAMINIRP